MGIGSITSTNSMSGMQMITSASKDTKSKSIQNEITNAQQQMQKLSSNDELSVNEKTNERKKLQQEISNLNTELKQHQDTLRKSQQREIRMAELQEENEPAKEEKAENQLQAKESSSDKTDEKNLPADKQQTGQSGTVISENNDGTVILKGGMNQDEKDGVDSVKWQADEPKKEDAAEKETKKADSDTSAETGLSRKEMHSITSADSSVQQARRQGAIIARIKDGIAVLKGEINQDEKRDVNTDRKEAELEKLEKKEQRATSFQSSILGEANNTMKPETKINVAGIKDDSQANAENNAFINAMDALQEAGQASQQRFNVSFGF